MELRFRYGFLERLELGTEPIIGPKFLEARSKCNLGLGLSLALLVFFGYGLTLVVRLHMRRVRLSWDPVPVGVICSLQQMLFYG